MFIQNSSTFLEFFAPNGHLNPKVASKFRLSWASSIVCACNRKPSLNNIQFENFK